MRVRNIAIFSAAVLAGALGGSLIGPRPAEAVARELIELEHHGTSLEHGTRAAPWLSLPPPCLPPVQQRAPAPLPQPTLFTPTGSATSPAANTISPARNFRITSSTTARPTSHPTPSSISAKLPILRRITIRPSPNTTRSSQNIRRVLRPPLRT